MMGDMGCSPFILTDNQPLASFFENLKKNDTLRQLIRAQSVKKLLW
jgi:hypothetical protein